jgi:hypothetical protein
LGVATGDGVGFGVAAGEGDGSPSLPVVLLSLGLGLGDGFVAAAVGATSLLTSIAVGVGTAVGNVIAVGVGGRPAITVAAMFGWLELELGPETFAADAWPTGGSLSAPQVAAAIRSSPATTVAPMTVHMKLLVLVAAGRLKMMRRPMTRASSAMMTSAAMMYTMCHCVVPLMVVVFLH